MIKGNSPCYECKDRKVGCHGPDCPNGWNEYQESLKERRKIVKQESDLRTVLLNGIGKGGSI